jgi:hypothetical protein
MKSNLTYLLASGVAALIALGIVFAAVPEPVNWNDAASGPLRPFTSNEAERMAGEFQRVSPDAQGELLMLAASQLTANLEAATVPDNGNRQRGPAVWDSGRADFSADPCALKLIRRGWDTIIVIDNGLCAGAGVDLSGEYVRRAAAGE